MRYDLPHLTSRYMLLPEELPEGILHATIDWWLAIGIAKHISVDLHLSAEAAISVLQATKQWTMMAALAQCDRPDERPSSFVSLCQVRARAASSMSKERKLQLALLKDFTAQSQQLPTLLQFLTALQLEITKCLGSKHSACSMGDGPTGRRDGDTNAPQTPRPSPTAQAQGADSVPRVPPAIQVQTVVAAAPVQNCVPTICCNLAPSRDEMETITQLNARDPRAIPGRLVNRGRIALHRHMYTEHHDRLNDGEFDRMLAIAGWQARCSGCNRVWYNLRTAQLHVDTDHVRNIRGIYTTVCDNQVLIPLNVPNHQPIRTSANPRPIQGAIMGGIPTTSSAARHQNQPRPEGQNAGSGARTNAEAGATPTTMSSAPVCATRGAPNGRREISNRGDDEEAGPTFEGRTAVLVWEALTPPATTMQATVPASLSRRTETALDVLSDQYSVLTTAPSPLTPAGSAPRSPEQVLQLELLQAITLSGGCGEQIRESFLRLMRASITSVGSNPFMRPNSRARPEALMAWMAPLILNAVQTAMRQAIPQEPSRAETEGSPTAPLSCICVPLHGARHPDCPNFSCGGCCRALSQERRLACDAHDAAASPIHTPPPSTLSFSAPPFIMTGSPSEAETTASGRITQAADDSESKEGSGNACTCEIGLLTPQTGGNFARRCPECGMLNDEDRCENDVANDDDMGPDTVNAAATDTASTENVREPTNPRRSPRSIIASLNAEVAADADAAETDLNTVAETKGETAEDLTQIELDPSGNGELTDETPGPEACACEIGYLTPLAGNTTTGRRCPECDGIDRESDDRIQGADAVDGDCEGPDTVERANPLPGDEEEVEVRGGGGGSSSSAAAEAGAAPRATPFGGSAAAFARADAASRPRRPSSGVDGGGTGGAGSGGRAGTGPSNPVHPAYGAESLPPAAAAGNAACGDTTGAAANPDPLLAPDINNGAEIDVDASIGTGDSNADITTAVPVPRDIGECETAAGSDCASPGSALVPAVAMPAGLGADTADIQAPTAQGEDSEAPQGAARTRDSEGARNGGPAAERDGRGPERNPASQIRNPRLEGPVTLSGLLVPLLIASIYTFRGDGSAMDAWNRDLTLQYRFTQALDHYNQSNAAGSQGDLHDAEPQVLAMVAISELAEILSGDQELIATLSFHSTSFGRRNPHGPDGSMFFEMRGTQYTGNGTQHSYGAEGVNVPPNATRWIGGYNYIGALDQEAWISQIPLNEGAAHLVNNVFSILMFPEHNMAARRILNARPVDLRQGAALERRNARLGGPQAPAELARPVERLLGEGENDRVEPTERQQYEERLRSERADQDAAYDESLRIDRARDAAAFAEAAANAPCPRFTAAEEREGRAQAALRRHANAAAQVESDAAPGDAEASPQRGLDDAAGEAETQVGPDDALADAEAPIQRERDGAASEAENDDQVCQICQHPAAPACQMSACSTIHCHQIQRGRVATGGPDDLHSSATANLGVSPAATQIEIPTIARDGALVGRHSLNTVATPCPYHSDTCIVPNCDSGAIGCLFNLCRGHCTQRSIGRGQLGHTTSGVFPYRYHTIANIPAGTPPIVWLYGSDTMEHDRAPPLTDCAGDHAAPIRRDEIPGLGSSICGAAMCRNVCYSECMNSLCQDCCRNDLARGRGLIRCSACEIGRREARPGDEDCVICSLAMTEDANDPAHVAPVVHNMRCTHALHAACLARVARDGYAADLREDDGEGEPIGIRCPMCRARWHSCHAGDAASQMQDEAGQVHAFLPPRHCAVCANEEAHPRCEYLMCSTCCTARDCTYRGEHREPALPYAARRRIDRWLAETRAERMRIAILTDLNNRNARRAAGHESASAMQPPTNSERQSRNAELRRRIEATTLPSGGASEAAAINEQQANGRPQGRAEVITILDAETGEGAEDGEAQAPTLGSRMDYMSNSINGPCLVVQRIDPENGVTGELEREGIHALVHLSESVMPQTAGLPVMVRGNRPNMPWQSIQADGYSCGQHCVQGEISRQQGHYDYADVARHITAQPNGGCPTLQTINNCLGAQQGGALTGNQIESAVEILGSDLDTSHCGPYLGAIAASMVQGEAWRRRFERRAQDILQGGGFGITLNTAPPRERGHWVHYSVYYSASGFPHRGAIDAAADPADGAADLVRQPLQQHRAEPPASLGGPSGDLGITDDAHIETHGGGDARQDEHNDEDAGRPSGPCEGGTDEAEGANRDQTGPFLARAPCSDCGIDRRGTPEDLVGPEAALCQQCSTNRLVMRPPSALPPPRPPPFGAAPRPPPLRQIECRNCLQETAIDDDDTTQTSGTVACRCGADIIVPPPPTLEEKMEDARDAAPAMEPGSLIQDGDTQQSSRRRGRPRSNHGRGQEAGARREGGGDDGGDSGSGSDSGGDEQEDGNPDIPPAPPPPPPPNEHPAPPEQQEWIDEVSWEQIATMTQATTHIKNIPRSVQQRFKEALTTAARFVTEPDPALTQAQIMRQRDRGAKLISLLPSLALRYEKGNQAREMAIRLDRIRDHQWEGLYREFALAYRARTPRVRGPGPTAASRIARASALLAIGEISRAMRQLTAGGMCPANSGTLEALRALHPEAAEEWMDDDWINPTPDSPGIQIKPKYFTQALRSMARGSAAGLTGLRTDWLRLMIPAGESHTTAETIAQEADENSDLKPLRILVELLMNGHLGEEASKFFGGAKLCALEKANGEPRPLAIGDALRRLGARAVMQQHEDTFASLLAPLGQMGVAVPGAADKIALARRLRIERDPSRAIVAIDTRNAYNTCCRRRILSNLKRHPELHFLIPSFKAFYASNPHLFYAMDGEVGIIESKTGVQQGDGLAALYYSIGTMDSLQELKDMFADDGICILAYIDDVTFDCPPELAPAIYAAWSAILLRNTHQTCRPEKTKIWSPTANLVTQEMTHLLREFKVAPMGGQGAGIIVMGVPIGTHAYEQAYVEHIAFGRHVDIFGAPSSPGMEEEYARIAEMPTRQEAFLLQRYCQGTTRVNHFMRGIEGDRVNPALQDVDDLGMRAMEKAIAGPDFNALQKRQASLPLGMGGLALRSAVDTRRGAWVASWATAVGTKHPIQEIDPTLAGIVRNPSSFSALHTVQILLDEWAIITAPAPRGSTPNALRHSIQRVNAGLTTNTWLNQYGKAWRTSHVTGGIEANSTVLLHPPPLNAQHDSEVAHSWDKSSASIDAAIIAMPGLDRRVAQARHESVPASLLEPWAKITKTHQRHLTQHGQRVSFLANIAAMVGHNTEIAMIRSNSTFQAFSRFDAVPSRHGFTANDPTWMRMAWKRVTGAPDPRTTGGPDRCPCCGSIMRENSHADSCRAGGRPTIVHNELRNVFQLACKAAGVTTTREQRHLLPLVGSGNTRPGDITFLTPQGVTVCVDVGVAGMAPSRDRASLATAKAGRLADLMEQKKRITRHTLRLGGETKTMEELCRTHGLEYMPACVDNAGAWGHNMRTLINRLGGYAHAAHGIPPHIFTLAWTRRISLTLARVQALVATQRIAELAPVEDDADLGATLDAQGLYNIR